MPLSGVWYNQLGSKMELTLQNGQVSGTYESSVGAAAGKGPYKLSGRTDTDQDLESQNIGFTVSWENDKGSLDSVTSWSGQMQTIEGKEIISTFWILTIETKADVNWKSRLIGSDRFGRSKPSATDVDLALKLGPASHPL
jgi:hypothetical protein